MVELTDGICYNRSFQQPGVRVASQILQSSEFAFRLFECFIVILELQFFWRFEYKFIFYIQFELFKNEKIIAFNLILFDEGAYFHLLRTASTS